MVDSTLLAAAGSTSGSTTLFLIGAALLVLWIVSLNPHPYTTCSHCKGTPRGYGSFATKSFRICSTCGGNGRRLRIGARLFTSKDG